MESISTNPPLFFLHLYITTYTTLCKDENSHERCIKRKMTTCTLALFCASFTATRGHARIMVVYFCQWHALIKV